MPGPSIPYSHFLLVPLPAFGHTRPVCVLAARLVLEEENVVLTFFAPPHQFEQVRKDISNQLPDSLISSDVKEKALKRIRIVTTFKSTDNNVFNLSTPFFQSYPGAYETLYHGRPFTCATTGKVFDAMPPPVAVILDHCSLPQLQATRALSGTSVAIIAMIILPASYMICYFGPESQGGITDFGRTVDGQARVGASPDGPRNKPFGHTEGKIIKIAGLPDMYDYELFPQKLPFESPFAPVVRGGFQFFDQCDAALIASSYSYEGAALGQMKSHFKSRLPIYCVGPLLPSGYGRPSVVERSESNNLNSRVESDVQVFLNEMRDKYGKRSVVFISFGTIFWPMTPEYVDELIQVLIEKVVPFIFCNASPFAKLPEEIANNIKSSGLGFLTTWAPQQDVLNHSATGWFLTHGGNGGVTESLGSGVPLICWPFDGDQPTTSAHLSCTLKVAFELIEVRTGSNGLKPMLRNGLAAKGTREAVGRELREVIDACRGEAGSELTKNAQKLKWKFQKAWEDGGEAKRELNAFLKRYVLGMGRLD
ncbi:glycosyltransferase family 1 protein [Hebeloma cylindrosporum]|uniref:Glycosyltransferase family 1 protein n=1 Tax=Hebeloma cylindrosporum TaxID=76867 RepID=A0A0C2Z1N7_HEBCY|nr:glycosyltransferase family 1 protein [Hebeloma cylindrosporum h7]